MAIDTIKSHLAKNNLKGSVLLAIATGILFFWTLITAGNSPSPVKIWQFMMQYIGFTAYPLVPMAVFVLASMVMLTIEKIEHVSVWAKTLKCIEVTAPVLGIIGTFVGIGLALKSLGAGAIIGEAITLMIGQIGTCIWSTVVGMAVGIMAYILVENGVSYSEEEETDSVKDHPVLKAILRREERLIDLLKNQKAEIVNLRNQTGLPTKISTESREL